MCSNKRQCLVITIAHLSFSLSRQNDIQHQELTRHCDIYFTDGYISIVVKRHVLDHHIVEYLDWRTETLRFYFKTSDTTAVVNRNRFCEVHWFQTIGTFLYNNWLLWAVLEHWWLIICNSNPLQVQALFVVLLARSQPFNIGLSTTRLLTPKYRQPLCTVTRKPTLE